MISIEEAQASAFQSSVTDELRAYCDQAGIGWHHREKDQTLRARLCDALGILNPTKPQKIVRPLNVKSKGDIFPPYNLTGNGKWGGRRHRLSLNRPPDAKIEAGKYFNAGGIKFGLEYEKLTAVPEPVYLQLMATRRVQAKNMPHDLGDGVVERRTDFFDVGEKYPFSYRGVDPDTADRAGSLAEWYQDKGPKWFRELPPRDIERVMQYCDVHPKTYRDAMPTHEDKVDALLIHFFGHADVEEAEAA